MFAPRCHTAREGSSVLVAGFQRDTDRERDEEGRGCESSSCFGLENKRFMERKILCMLFEYVIYIITFINDLSNPILNIWYVVDPWNMLPPFSPRYNPIRCVLLFPLDRWWNWSLEKLSDLPKFTHLVSDKAEIHIQVLLDPKAIIFLLLCLPGMWKRVHFLCVMPENRIRTTGRTSKG